MADADHRVVKVAGDLDRQSAIVEGLAKFAVRDFAAADEDDRLHQLRRTAVQRQRSAGVAGAGTGGSLGSHQVRVGDRCTHAVVFETARRIHSLVLQVQLSDVHSDVLAHSIGLLQQGLTFADGDQLILGRERQQFVKPPDAAEADRIGPLRPHRLEISSTSWGLRRGPNRRRCPANLRICRMPYGRCGPRK